MAAKYQAITPFEQDEKGRFRWIGEQPLKLKGGGELYPLVQVFETWGTPNKAVDNVILIHHALSTNSHVAATEKNPEPGWWQEMVGPGKCLDSDKYFIVCITNLGSCFGSTGPLSENPETGKPYRNSFPNLDFADVARAQCRLLQDIGINKCFAMVGNSMGAMLSLQFAVMFPEMVERLMLISSSALAFPANIANRRIQREIIMLDPAWNNGNYRNGSDLQGFISARKFGLLTYRHWDEFNRRFLDKQGEESINNYLAYNSGKFVKYFDCNSYLTTLNMLDNYDPRDQGQGFAETFARLESMVHVLSVDSDVLYTPSQQRHLYDELVKAGVRVSYIDHHSTFGHDAFLVETDAFSEYIHQFLQDS